MTRRVLALGAVVAVTVAAASVALDRARQSRMRSTLRSAAETSRAAGAVRFEFTRSGDGSAPLSGGGTAALRTGDEAFTLGAGSAVTAEFRKVGGTIYSKVRGQGLPAALEGVWVSTGTPPSSPDFAALFASPGGISLDLLSRVGRISTAGRMSVRGAAASGYRAPVEAAEVDELRARLAGLRGSELRRARDALSGSLEVWIDTSGRVRRMRLAVRRTSDAPPGIEPFTRTVDLWDYGAAGSVDAPPAGEVRDEESLRTELGSAVPDQDAR